MFVCLNKWLFAAVVVVSMTQAAMAQYSTQYSNYGYQNSTPVYSQPQHTYSSPAYSYGYSGQRYQNVQTPPVYHSQSYQPRTYGNPVYGVQTNQSYVGSQLLNRRPTQFQPAHQAQPGDYYRWRTAEGTSEKGYLAHDGSRWKLLQASGIVRVDGSGRQQNVSSVDSGHPHKFVWQIVREATQRKTVWLSRNESTGSVSVLYQRPEITSASQFYTATATFEDQTRIVDLQWQRKPAWAASVNLVRNSTTPRLPLGIHRSTAQKYIPATSYDLAAAKRASTSDIPAGVKALPRPYEEESVAGDRFNDPASAKDQDYSRLSLTVQ